MNTDTKNARHGHVTVRAAKIADLAEVREIYAAAVNDTLITWDETPPPLADIEARFHRLTAAGYPFLVAANPQGGPRVAGYISTGPFHPQSGFRYTAEHSVYVRPEFQGSGLGRRLMSALLSELKAAGFRCLIAGVSSPGAEASLAFHKALGFTEAGRLPNTGFKMGQWLDAVYLIKDLGEPADLLQRR